MNIDFITSMSVTVSSALEELNKKAAELQIKREQVINIDVSKDGINSSMYNPIYIVRLFYFK